MRTVNATEARSGIGQLLDRVARGEEIMIMRRGKPAAMLVRVPRSKRNLKKLVGEMFEMRDSSGPRLRGLTIRELIEEGRKS